MVRQVGHLSRGCLFIEVTFDRSLHMSDSRMEENHREVKVDRHDFEG